MGLEQKVDDVNQAFIHRLLKRVYTTQQEYPRGDLEETRINHSFVDRVLRRFYSRNSQARKKDYVQD